MELTAAAAWLNTSFADFDLAIMLAVHKLYEAAGFSARSLKLLPSSETAASASLYFPFFSCFSRKQDASELQCYSA